MITTDAPVRQDGRLVLGDPARFAAQVQSALPGGVVAHLRIAAAGTDGPEVLAVPMVADGLLLSVTLTAEQVATVVGDAVPGFAWAVYRITAGSGDALAALFAGTLRVVSRWEGVAQGALLAGVSEAQAARISASAAEAARVAAAGSASAAAGSADAAASSASAAAGSASTAATAATAAAQAAVESLSSTYATVAQGAKADSAVQPEEMPVLAATYGTSGATSKAMIVAGMASAANLSPYTVLNTNPGGETGLTSVEVWRNYMAYPRFENGNTTGWASVAPSGTVTISASTDRAYLGTQSLKCICDGSVTAQGVTSLYSSASSSGSTAATASAYVYAPSGAALLLKVSEVTTAGAMVTDALATTPITGTGTWQRVSLSVTKGTAANVLLIRVLSNAATAVTFYVDCVMLATVAAAPYFDGSYSPDSDLTPSWTGTAYASASILSGMAVANIAAASPGTKVIQSSQWVAAGSKSVRLIPITTSADTAATIAGSTSSLTGQGVTLVAGQTYTVVATCRLAAAQTGTTVAQRCSIQMTSNTVTGWTGATYAQSTNVPNAAGTTTLRATFTVPAGSVWAQFRIFGGASAGNGDVWWDQINIIAGSYSAPPATGDSPNGYWTGTANASTSVIYADGASNDATYGNWGTRKLAYVRQATGPTSGNRLTLLETAGAGVVESMHIICAGLGGMRYVLEVYADGATTPQVSADLQSLFGYGWLDETSTDTIGFQGPHINGSAEITATPAYHTNGSVNYKIPYSNGIKIVLANLDAASGTLVWSNIAYTVGDPKTSLRLRSSWVRYTDSLTTYAPADNIPCGTLSGTGMLVYHGIVAKDPAATGTTYLERSMMMRCGGESTASVASSGTEDWFYSAFYGSIPGSTWTTGPMVGANGTAAMGIDLLGAMGGVPFTGGATLILEPNGGTAITHSVRMGYLALYYA